MYVAGADYIGPVPPLSRYKQMFQWADGTMNYNADTGAVVAGKQCGFVSRTAVSSSVDRARTKRMTACLKSLKPDERTNQKLLSIISNSNAIDILRHKTCLNSHEALKHLSMYVGLELLGKVGVMHYLVSSRCIAFRHT